MAYGNFTTIRQIKEELGVISRYCDLFKKIEKVEPSEWLKTTLSYSYFMRSKNEKSKSETIVQPILMEIVKNNKDFITFFSGNTIDADKERGLNGECDFVITNDIGSLYIESSILQIVEAKDHNLKLGISQCAAQMIGAKIFNEKNNVAIDCIYGCATTGDVWQFMKFLDNKVFIDTKKYYLSEVENILGIFQTIINQFIKLK